MGVGEGGTRHMDYTIFLFQIEFIVIFIPISVKKVYLGRHLFLY